jgi:hypothetical protein
LAGFPNDVTARLKNAQVFARDLQELSEMTCRPTCLRASPVPLGGVVADARIDLL